MEILTSLGIDPARLVWQAVNFLILLFVLQRFLYKPVLHMLDQRATRIRESMTHAEEIRQERQRVEEEAKHTRDEAWQHAQALLADAQKSADALLAEARVQAKEEADLFATRIRAELAREREQAFQELRVEVANLAVSAAGYVIGHSLDDASHRQLIREFLSETNGQAASSSTGP